MPEAGQSILLVDDDEVKRHITAQILRRAGFEVIEAATGAEALSRIYEEPGLIILDVKLPDMTGFEVALRLRQTPAAHTPVLHLSATFVREEDRARGLEQGAVGYLTYPVEPVVLVAHARSLLRLGRSEWERERLLRRERNARRQAEHSQRRFRVLADLGRVVGQGLDPDALVEAAFDVLVPAVAEGAAVVRAWEEEGGTLHVRVRHRDPERVEGLRVWCEQGGPQLLSAAGMEAILSGAPSATAEVDSELRLHLIPMRFGEAIEGALILQRRAPDAPVSQADLLLFEDLGARLGGALAHSHAFARTRAAQLRAEEANAARDHFMAAITRELRQPLASVSSWLNVLRRDRLTPEQKAEAIDVLQQRMQQQLSFVDELGDIARTLSGKTSLEREPIDLREPVAHVIEAFDAEAQTAGVTLEQVPVDTPLWVKGDEERLTQVLEILVRNALQHTPRGGRVSLSGRSHADRVRIEVQDTGRGIAAEQLSRIFEPFWRDVPLAAEQDGLGLGLTVAKALAEQHEGSLQAQSGGPGKGATFTLNLPHLASPHTGREPVGLHGPH